MDKIIKIIPKQSFSNDPRKLSTKKLVVNKRIIGVMNKCFRRSSFDRKYITPIKANQSRACSKKNSSGVLNSCIK